MSGNEQTTLELIHAAAKAEFMKKGFRSASLRNIVKIAGVTTGAFYGYYKSKEELFEVLVGDKYEYLMSRYKEAHKLFAGLPMEEQPDQMGKISNNCMELLLYTQRYREEFRLILQRSEGTRFSSMIDEMVEIEVQSTHEFYKVFEKAGKTVAKD